MHPYSENPLKDTYGRTRNWRDSLNIFEDSLGPEAKYNPVFKTHLLGGVIRQGVIGYITIVSLVFFFTKRVMRRVKLSSCDIGC
jgi:hypothetical protein